MPPDPNLTCFCFSLEVMLVDRVRLREGVRGARILSLVDVSAGEVQP